MGETLVAGSLPDIEEGGGELGEKVAFSEPLVGLPEVVESQVDNPEARTEPGALRLLLRESPVNGMMAETGGWRGKRGQSGGV